MGEEAAPSQTITLSTHTHRQAQAAAVGAAQEWGAALPPLLALLQGQTLLSECLFLSPLLVPS